MEPQTRPDWETESQIRLEQAANIYAAQMAEFADIQRNRRAMEELSEKNSAAYVAAIDRQSDVLLKIAVALQELKGSPNV